MINAIVTGHSKGLGAGIAAALLQRGVSVLGLARSGNPTLKARFPNQLHELQIDLAMPGAINTLQNAPALATFATQASQLLLVNNAGLVGPIGPLNKQDPQTVANSVQLNVTVPLALSAMLAQGLQTGQQLRVLHVSSGAGRNAYPGWAVYCASKAALDMHAMAAQKDNAANVRVCSLAPGVIDTDMQAEIRAVHPTLFPNKARFIDLKNSGELTDPNKTGEAIVNYLLRPGFGEQAVADLRTL